MKRVLITGQGSYIGTSFESWLRQWPEKYKVDSINMKDESWRSISFAEYDVILHVAGIAHVSADPRMESLYYRVNRDLAIDTARKAKSDKVKQFIFLSSMIIYGDDGTIGEKKEITKSTKPNPSNFYGKSKLDADNAIQKISSSEFKTVIIRTPMVYGPNCKGNFPILKKYAKFLSVFPDIDNERSMIYIDNLCEFFRLLIENESRGVFYPQNEDYIATKDIIREFRRLDGKKTYFIKSFNPILRLLSKRFSVVNKVFGNKVYEKNISMLPTEGEYRLVSFVESIKRCR